jgi:four helix bundle protein
VTVYKLTAHFPETERFGLTSQFRRAAASIPANIAEGWGRGSTKEYVQFLLIARGSLMELETHAIIARELTFLSQDQLTAIQNEVLEIGKMLNSLIQALRRKHATLVPGPEPPIPNP